MATIVVPSIGVAAERWSRRSSAAGMDYQRGVESTQKDWQQAAGAAEGSYKTGVTAAANAGRFGRGITRAGTQKWRRKTLENGVPRFSQGVLTAQPDYQAGFAPFLEAISRVDLPPRGPAGSPQNYQRVQPIGQALNALKTRA